jgi:hypothetical protein
VLLFVLVLVLFVLVLVVVFVLFVLVFVVFVLVLVVLVLVFVVLVLVFVVFVLVFVVFVELVEFVLVFVFELVLVFVIKSQTARNGFIETPVFEIVGSANVGTVAPPFRKAAVPVGDTKMMFEFNSVALLHGSSQKVTIDGISVGAVHGPDVTCPRSSNRYTIVDETVGFTIAVFPRAARFTTLVSSPRSSTPFWFWSVITENEVGLKISTRACSLQDVGRRFTESKRARSRASLNSRAMF